jgi:hypothetical protein
MHASLFPEDKQTEGRRSSANFILSTAALTCIAGMQKKKKRKEKFQGYVSAL